MKRLDFVFIFLATTLILTSCKNDSYWSANWFWNIKIMPKFLDKKNGTISIMVVNTKYTTDSTQDKYTIIRNDSCEVYLNHDDGLYCMFTDKNVFMINTTNQELMCGDAGGDFYTVYYNQYFIGKTRFFWALLSPKKNRYHFTSIKDSVINNSHYKILRREDRSGYTSNPTTGVFNIPRFFYVDYYYNTDIQHINQIHIIPLPESEDVAKEECFGIIYSFEDQMVKLYHLFDFSNPMYGNYSIHDDYNLPYSWRTSRLKSDTLTERALSYPIVSLYGDTTCINQVKGWILLDFWFYGCKSCFQWFNELAKEKDSLNYRELERQGITIMCINALSDNNEKLCETALHYDAADVIYHAKGFGNLLDIYAMPQFYLISPDKKIALKTNNLKDYKELLEMKKKWEKQGKFPQHP